MSIYQRKCIILKFIFRCFPWQLYDIIVRLLINSTISEILKKCYMYTGLKENVIKNNTNIPQKFCNPSVHR